ncbi:MAG: winged helix-turn-helix transcriptional regulator [Chitinispirillia bacterium]|nr:winged helix-turn-helix transcriptional regulator [Chitinispirillia bacterium]MCL2267897.1 winged helix-turn-helix transcriptional regulator [Chitinispirillia bacterium]
MNGKEREKRSGTGDRRRGDKGVRAGTNPGEWEDICERRNGIGDRRGSVGINGQTAGIPDKKVGTTAKKVGINSEWEDIREKRAGTNDRRGRINNSANIVITGRKDATRNQMHILSCIAQNPYATAENIAPQVGISVRKTEANLQKLKARGILERVGARKNGYWLIKSLEG